MRMAMDNGLVGFLISLCLLVGCQSAQKTTAGTTHASAENSIAKREPKVLHDIGPVTVYETVYAELVLWSQPTEHIAEKERIQKAGYDLRGSPGIVKLKHKSGLTASVSYFTELTDDTTGVGALSYRKSGDAKALISIENQYVGDCTIRKPLMEIATISAGRPEALDDGEKVSIGSVKVGSKQFEVVSNCRHIGDQGSVSVFFSGRNRLICHEYQHDGHVLARRTRSPEEEFVEFSGDLSPTEQLCIAADMNFRLNEERAAKAAANVIYMPVPM